MGLFLTPDGVTCRHFTDGSGRAELLSDIEYRDDTGRVWRARASSSELLTLGDGASVPRLLWPFVGHPFDGEHQRAAWLHDVAYQQAQATSIIDAIRSKERDAADWMFHCAIRDNETANAARRQPLARWRVLSRLLRFFCDGDDTWAMYLGVRLGGWWAYWNHAKRNARAGAAR
jgi:hypothetical protein